MYWPLQLAAVVALACVSCDEVEDDSKIEIIEDVFPQAELESVPNDQLPVKAQEYEEYIPLDVKEGEYPNYDENPTTEKSRMRPNKKTKPPRVVTRRTRYQRIKDHREMVARRKALKAAVKEALRTSTDTPPR